MLVAFATTGQDRIVSHLTAVVAWHDGTYISWHPGADPGPLQTAWVQADHAAIQERPNFTMHWLGDHLGVHTRAEIVDIGALCRRAGLAGGHLLASAKLGIVRPSFVDRCRAADLVRLARYEAQDPRARAVVLAHTAWTTYLLARLYAQIYDVKIPLQEPDAPVDEAWLTAFMGW